MWSGEVCPFVSYVVNLYNSVLASINADGTRIAFESTANINGGNPDLNSEIFLAVCIDLSTRTIPTLSEWGLIAMASILGLVGFIVIRRRGSSTKSYRFR